MTPNHTISERKTQPDNIFALPPCRCPADYRIFGLLYCWRLDQGISPWRIAEVIEQAEGIPAHKAARLFYDVQEGRLDPMDPRLGPIWRYVESHGGEGLPIKQLRWFQGVRI